MVIGREPRRQRRNIRSFQSTRTSNAKDGSVLRDETRRAKFPPALDLGHQQYVIVESVPVEECDHLVPLSFSS